MSYPMAIFPKRINSFDRNDRFILGYYWINIGIAAYASNGSKKMQERLRMADMWITDCKLLRLPEGSGE